MSRAARLLELMTRLQQKPAFTVDDLAGEMTVSRRTMLRDLHALSEMGVPLSARPGPGGGYSLITGRRVLPLSLTAEEAVGVILSYEAFLVQAQSPFAEQSLSAVSKLRSLLTPEVTRELDRVRRHVAVVAPSRSYTAPLLADLLHAALDRAYLRAVYESRSGQSERIVFPYGIFSEHGFWYCAAFDVSRGHVLTLRADRFARIERIDGQPPAPELDLQGWLAARYADTGEDALSFRIRANRYAARSFPFAALFGELPLDPNGFVTVEGTIPRTEISYYAAQLLPLGKDAEVLSPPEMIEEMRRLAQGVVDLYAGVKAVSE